MFLTGFLACCGCFTDPETSPKLTSTPRPPIDNLLVNSDSPPRHSNFEAADAKTFSVTPALTHPELEMTDISKAQQGPISSNVEEVSYSEGSSQTTGKKSDSEASGSLQVVYSTPLDALHGKILDLTPYFSEEHYRFIDADAFVHQRTLVIRETSILPQLYTVISYVWFGLEAEPSQLEQDGSFSVFCGTHSDGSSRENGGPISLKVLEYACRWASDSQSSDLWLDRLCIMQTSKTDKAWQISRMYDIYESSEQCVVLPGGLQRLASMSDQTEWADRAWTYQEAIVTWDYAVVLTRDWYRSKGEQHWLVDGECHWQYLHQLFMEGEDILAGEGLSLILGRNAKALNTLRRIVEYKSWNHFAAEGEETMNVQTIRQLTLHGVAMRTSSRPVDMVFSILGSLDVPEAFEGCAGDFKENERFRATLTLVEAMLRLDDDEGAESATSNSLVDVPLWQSLELTGPPGGESREFAVSLDIPNYPTLRDLGELLDGDLTDVQISADPLVSLKRESLREWGFDVEQTEDDSSVKAQAVVHDITPDALLNVYHGDQGRVVIRHADEGVIELCRKLDMTTDAELDLDLELIVFGWSLRLDRHPYIRFYKFDISQLFS